MEDRKVVKINGALYDAAQLIAAEQGITMGDAVEEATRARGQVGHQHPGAPNVCTPEAIEAGFRSELRLAGVQAPRKVNWVFGVLDSLPPEMIEGTRLEPYGKALAEAERKCAETQTKLQAALEQLPNELEDVPEVVPDVPAPQESAVS